MFREFSASQQGRWISPDPAGMSAVDPTNPQSWNRYAYVGNTPLSATDPDGLMMSDSFDDSFNGGSFDGVGPYTNTGYCPPWYAYCGDPLGGGFGIILGGGEGGGGGGSHGGNGGTGSPPRAQFPNGENLGLPPWLPLPRSNLTDFLIPGSHGCEFGPCAASDFLGPAAVPIVAACTAQPEACLIIGWAAIVLYNYYFNPASPHNQAHATASASAIDPYNQFLEDLKKCTERYVPGPSRDECYKQARDKYRLATGRGPVN